MNRSRLQRLRNAQAPDWYPAIALRPLAILALLVCADWRFVTPNGLTTLSTLAKLAGAGLLLVDDWTAVVAGVVVLQIGAVLDHMDGCLARYRGQSSTLGAFYDKIADVVTWFFIAAAVGWLAYRETGDGLMIVLATWSAYALACIGYMKWLIAAETEKRKPPIDPTAGRAPPEPPPERTFGQWVSWFFKAMAQIYRFEELDLYFWVGLFVLIGELEILMWILAVTQSLQLAVMIVKRTLQARALDAG